MPAMMVMMMIPVDTGRKMNVHKTYRTRPGRLLNVLCTFNVRPVSTGRRFAGNFPKSAMQQFLRITQDN